ncbi:MAG: Fic family protein [Methanobrevibacter sp.]|jgi:Fic family protein|nr:Fic family protein [Candidatus Methanovirga basalitermitum]
MDYNKLKEKKDLFNKNKHLLGNGALENYTIDFDVNFTHSSTAIEGNTLSLKETKLLIEDKVSVGAKKLREIYEVVNHDKAWQYAKEKVNSGNDLSEEIIKGIHRILMDNIEKGGEYRNMDLIITGAKHKPPSHFIVRYEIDNFYNTLKNNDFDEITLAAYTHGEFVKIHPFSDGNGRTSRIIMNYQLIQGGFLPIFIKVEEKEYYYDILDEYAANNNLNPFIEFIFKLEEKQIDFYLKQIEFIKN